MKKFGLEDIRRANVRQIFALIEEGVKTSRFDLAQDTGLSLMTVGKIIDIFEKNGAVVLETSDMTKVGRKAKYIMPDKRRCELVIEREGGSVSVSLYDIALNRLGSLQGSADALDGLLLEALGMLGSGKLIGIGATGFESDSEITVTAENFGVSVSLLTTPTIAGAYSAVLSSMAEGVQLMYVDNDSMQAICFDGREAAASVNGVLRHIPYNGSKAYAAAAAAVFAAPSVLFVAGDRAEFAGEVENELARLGVSDITVRSATSDAARGAAYLVRDAFITECK